MGVCAHFPSLAREFSRDAAAAVGERRCPHNEPPPELDAGAKGEALIKAAAVYVVLCGRSQVDVIAAVHTGDVVAK